MMLEGFREYVKSLRLADDPRMEIVRISCWANVLRCGQSLTLHHHNRAVASAHYTVTTGCENGVAAKLPDSGHSVYYRPGFADRHGSTAKGTVSPWDDDWAMPGVRSPRP